MTEVEIKDEHGMKAMGKPVGKYITLEFSDREWEKSDETGIEKVLAGIVESIIVEKVSKNRKVAGSVLGEGDESINIKKNKKNEDWENQKKNKECGFEQEDCYTLLGSLVRENVATMVEHGTEFALTGPIERNDIETVKKHLTVCSDSRIKNTYCNIGQELIDIAQKKYPNRDYTALRKILSESD